MALRDKLRERAQPLLEPDEQIQAVFLTQSGPNPGFLFLTYLIVFWTKYWVVAVTDKRIAVLSAPRMAPSKPKALADSLPRDTPIPEPGGKLWTELQLGDTRYWVHRRFWSDLRAANAAVPAPAPAAS